MVPEGFSVLSDHPFLHHLYERHDTFFVRRSAVKSQNRIMRIALHPAQAAAVPTAPLVEVMSRHGACRECYQNFITRWHDAYITKIAFRFKESFLTDKKLTLE